MICPNCGHHIPNVIGIDPNSYQVANNAGCAQPLNVIIHDFTGAAQLGPVIQIDPVGAACANPPNLWKFFPI